MFIRFTGPKYRIEVRTKTSGKWYWRLVSNANDEPLAHSEQYSSRAKAIQTARALSDNTGLPLTEHVQ